VRGLTEGRNGGPGESLTGGIADRDQLLTKKGSATSYTEGVEGKKVFLCQEKASHGCKPSRTYGEERAPTGWGCVTWDRLEIYCGRGRTVEKKRGDAWVGGKPLHAGGHRHDEKPET